MNKTTCPICDGGGKSHDLDDLDCGRCGGTGAVDCEDLDDSDDIGMDPDDGPEGWEHPWIPRKMCRIEKVRWVETGAQLRHNQWRREYARPMRKRMKRLSAMRRQGRGGGR